MHKLTLILLVSAGLAVAAAVPQVDVTADAATGTSATSYCRSLHRNHPATYHHRYGHNRRSFGRCTARWRHDHAGHDHSDDD